MSNNSKKYCVKKMKKNFKIGHFSDTKNITGCSVILCPEKTTASCYVSGSSPGSRETALLEPSRKIEHIHALLLTGGSAFGLNAAAGVVNYLEEKNIGYKTPYGTIPIVPAAVIFDLNIGNSKVRPTAENAYQACITANDNFSEQGSIGAGIGATVGKWAGISSCMKGGLGIAEVNFENVWVRAISVVNSVGDVIDAKGNIIAGALDKKNNFISEKDKSLRWCKKDLRLSENTVLSAVLTNAKISKLQAYILAQRAQTGFARAINPGGTSYDGDIIFAISNGTTDYNVEIVYEMAIEAVHQSIIAGVRNADSLGGFPSINDLKAK